MLVWPGQRPLIKQLWSPPHQDNHIRLQYFARKLPATISAPLWQHPAHLRCWAPRLPRSQSAARAHIKASGTDLHIHGHHVCPSVAFCPNMSFLYPTHYAWLINTMLHNQTLPLNWVTQPSCHLREPWRSARLHVPSWAITARRLASFAPHTVSEAGRADRLAAAVEAPGVAHRACAAARHSLGLSPDLVVQVAIAGTAHHAQQPRLHSLPRHARQAGAVGGVLRKHGEVV